MGLFDRVRDLFGRKPGPYEEAQSERVEAIRGAVPEDASGLDYLLAMVALISEAEEKDVGPDTRILEDLAFGDTEYMELEILCEDLFGIQISSAELNLADTLGDLARTLDRKRGIDSKRKAPAKKKEEAEDVEAGDEAEDDGEDGEEEE